MQPLNEHKENMIYSYMLFRNRKGELVELLRCRFTSDTDYYKAIMANHRFINIAKENSERKKIIGIIKRKK